ncbi:hypothetical protein A9Q84_11350 [Halobacteriovorax marinus]|uniref:Uncharacterized protein n=1 Tax=Halobacteriovorax marinus TaxID=97084 RepID=A0A1Y5F820_9BACT|nr:hypothetical protein A9Q84_11350 [Halobacteriovorax marinus]
MNTYKETYEQKLMEIINEANKKSNDNQRPQSHIEDDYVPLNALANSSSNFFAKFGSTKEMAYQIYETGMRQTHSVF